MMKQFEEILSGGDLRSKGKSDLVVLKIKGQDDFDELFKCLFHKDRIVVMRAADAIEKITINNPQYLAKHKKKIIDLCDVAKDKELKWHLALLVPRLQLTGSEFDNAWKTLAIWSKDKTNFRIVRVNSIQGLFEMIREQPNLRKNFDLILLELENENVPSINARIKNVRKQIGKQQQKLS